jgi:hypothetical protein
MVTRNDERVTCHLPDVDHPRISYLGVALEWLVLPKNR